MSRKIVGLAGAGLVLALAPVLSAQPAFAGSNPQPNGISLRPATVNANHPEAYFTIHRGAGQVMHDTVLVTNLATKPVVLLVNPVDGLTGATTGSVYANRGIPVTKAGTWLSVPSGKLSLGPKASLRVPFTVHVPTGASPGDHLAGIAFQNAHATTSSSGFQVKEVVRDVIGVLVVVPGTAGFQPSLVSLGIHEIGSTGIGSVLIGLGDTGRLLAKPVLSVDLHGPNGYHHSLTRQLDTVLPGDTVTYPYAWPDRLVKGTYTIDAALTGGDTTVHLQRTVHLGATLAGNTVPPVAESGSSSRPNALISALIGGLVVALVLGLVMVIVMRRRWRSPVGPV